MVRGTVPMKDGMLSVAWASEPPWGSVSTQAKSLDSRTTVENEVRTKAAAASSTIEISRVHSTSNVIAFKLAMAALSARSIARDAGRAEHAVPFLTLGGEEP